jgi:hypothetical protein
MNSINSHWIVVDIEPSIALARAECLQKYSAQVQNPRTPNMPKEEGVARSTYRRNLLRQFTKFLVSCLPFARAPRYRGLNYPADLQPSASTAYPRGA